MEISPELREKVLSDFRKIEPEMLRYMQSKEWKALTVYMPFYSDGVIDSVVYDVKEKRFTELRVTVAKGDVTRAMWSGDAVYCDDFEVVKIPL